MAKTLEAACWETWEHGGFGYGDMSYYNKGLLVGLMLDVAIRDATDGAKSLDDVMRAMFAEHKLPQPGFDDDAILKAVNTVAGTDLSPVYNQCVRSVQELPYGLLAKIGLRLVDSGENEWVSGFDSRRGRVDFVSADLRAMGLLEGDLILAWDGQITPSVPARFDSPEPYRLTVLRDGHEHNLHLVPVERTSRQLRIVRDPQASERAQRLRDGWLRMPRAEGVFNGIMLR